MFFSQYRVGNNPEDFFFHSPQPKILQNSEARSLNKCLTVGNFTGNKFYGIFQGFIFPTTPALELFFRPSLKGFLPVRFFPAILNRSETTLSKRHVLHQFRVQHPSFAVDAAGFTPTQDLENTNKLILNPHHTFFFPGHTCFFLAVNELNLTFLMVLLGSVFLLG